MVDVKLPKAGRRKVGIEELILFSFFLKVVMVVVPVAMEAAMATTREVTGVVTREDTMRVTVVDTEVDKVRPVKRGSV